MEVGGSIGWTEGAVLIEQLLKMPGSALFAKVNEVQRYTLTDLMISQVHNVVLAGIPVKKGSESLKEKARIELFPKPKKKMKKQDLDKFWAANFGGIAKENIGETPQKISLEKVTDNG